MDTYIELAERISAEELKANAKGLMSQPSRDTLTLAHGVIQQHAHIDKLERENKRLAQGKRDAEAYARLMLGR